MRHVYPNHEIPHLWAYQSQDEARNSTGSFYFEGPTIYSYGSHFPIARHVTNERGERAVLFTTAHHSVTTSSHCSAVARATPPNVPVFRVPHLLSSWGDLPNHTDNVESYVRRVSELLGKAKRARVNRDWHQREALGLREQLQGYVAFFNLRDVAVPGVGKLQGQEGISNLVEAFLVAGSKSVVASLWSADDTFASALMEQFYRHLAQREDSSSALRNAKLALLAKYGDQVSPFYWAAFIAVGETSTPMGIRQQ